MPTTRLAPAARRAEPCRPRTARTARRRRRSPGGPKAARSLWTGRRSAGRASRTHRAAPRAKWAGPWSGVGDRTGTALRPASRGNLAMLALRAARKGASAGRGWRPRRRPRHRCEGSRPPVRHMGTKMSKRVCAFGCVRVRGCVRACARHVHVIWMDQAPHRACECRGGGRAAQRAQQLLEAAELRTQRGTWGWPRARWTVGWGPVGPLVHVPMVPPFALVGRLPPF